jgi:hypothetical protein
MEVGGIQTVIKPISMVCIWMVQAYSSAKASLGKDVTDNGIC